jgi:hypothetical protein
VQRQWATRYLEEVRDDFLRVGLEGAVDKQKLKNVARGVGVSFATAMGLERV